VIARGQTWAIVHGAEQRGKRSALDDALVFEHALARAGRVVGEDRVIVAASERQRELWTDQLREVPAENIVVHPHERGSPAGILLPFLRIFRREPSARILVLPANHIVIDENIFEQGLTQALDATPGNDNRAVLIGTKPTTPSDPGDLLVLAPRRSGKTYELEAFETTRDIERRALLTLQGALIDSMVFAAGASAMMRLYEQTLPGLFRMFVSELRGQDAWTKERIAGLYRFLPRAELARDFLRPARELLRVQPVGECGFVHLEHLVDKEKTVARTRLEEMPTLRGSLAVAS
jgi:mannose-1-phosphate guanylyltransferase